MEPRQSESLEKLVPAFHGPSAKILAFLYAKGAAKPEDIQRVLGMPKSTAYKLLKYLVELGLVYREGGRPGAYRACDFKLSLENTLKTPKLIVTPRNILAFDAAHTPAGRFFIQHHGWEKFAKFIELYDAYTNGDTTAQLIARDLGGNKIRSGTHPG